jgi:pimeloyl-ACP methyl ester carboxylesterase
MDIIRSDGADLSATALGSGAAAVFLHGLVSGSMASWYFPIAVPLSSRRRVLLYDQRGHGGSSIAATGYDLDSQVVDLRAVLDHYGESGAVDMVGHSMGALIALQFALTYPQRVRRLVLVDAPVPAREFVAPGLLKVNSKDALHRCAENEFGFAEPLSGRRRQRFHERLEALFFQSSMVDDVLAMQAPADESLRRLSMPVLLIYGRRSHCIAAAQRLKQILPRPQLVLLDCGHYIPQESPELLREHLGQFLSAQAQRPWDNSEGA